MFGQEGRRAGQYRACKKKRPQAGSPEAVLVKPRGRLLNWASHAEGQR